MLKYKPTNVIVYSVNNILFSILESPITVLNMIYM